MKCFLHVRIKFVHVKNIESLTVADKAFTKQPGRNIYLNIYNTGTKGAGQRRLKSLSRNSRLSSGGRGGHKDFLNTTCTIENNVILYPSVFLRL